MQLDRIHDGYYFEALAQLLHALWGFFHGLQL